jgi:phospholipid transport system substrate-binding protein
MTAAMTRALAGIAIALTLAGPRDAGAGPPTDQLRQSVELVLKALADPELKKDTRTAERRATIRRVANDIFDFAEISQRSLGRYWQARTPTEREEFVRLFGDLLEQSYIAKIESYSDEKIQYTGEVVDGDQAVVKTRIVTKQGTEIPVEYRTLLKGDRWRAYDVNIEGVSLVANYRTQFNAIIQRNGYADLVARLKAKQNERPGPRETGRRPEESLTPTARPVPVRQSP